MRTSRWRRARGVAVGLCLAVGVAACATSTTGTPVVGGSQTRTTAASGDADPSGTTSGGPCASDRVGPARPAPDAVPLVAVSDASPWSPAWTQRTSLAIYADGTAALLPDPGSTGASGDALGAAVGGWIAGCDFQWLTGELPALGRADFGLPQVTDAGSTDLTVAGAGGKITSITAYALSVTDADGGLTAAQRAARRDLRGWLDRARRAITVTGPLPDRIRVTPTGADGGAAAVGLSPDPAAQAPVPWRGGPPPTACVVVTGAGADVALENMRSATAARTSGRTAAPAGWGRFTAADGRPVYLGMRQVLPGDGCPTA